MALKWRERSEWLLIIPGIIMALGGAGMLYLAATLPTVRSSMLISGIALIAGGIFMVWFGWGKDHHAEEEASIVATGVPATASIVSATPTGELVRKQPEVHFVLRLNVPGHPAYQVTHTQVLPAHVTLEELTPGTTLNVFSQANDVLDVVINFDPPAGAVPGSTPEPQPGFITPSGTPPFDPFNPPR